MLTFATPAFAQASFEDVSSALPAHAYTGGWEHFVGGGLAVFDCDGDTRPDIFAAGGTEPAILIRNLGDFSFISAEVPQITGATGAYPINIDGDEYVDIFVLRVGPNVILKGGPDCSFTDATRQFGITQDDRWSTAFTAWWEADRPHLAIGNYVDRTDPEGPFEACDGNVILVPDENGYNAELLTPGFCTLSILAANDARGRPTLRLSNDRHYYVSGGSEQMWDISDQRFLGPDDGWKITSLWGMGIAARDLNADGRDEIMLTSMGDQLLQIAQADGTYIAAPYSIGTYAQRPHVGDDGRPSTGWHAEFGDINNDGRADLFIAKGNVDQMPGMATRDPNNLLRQNVDGTFTEVSVTAGTASIRRSRGGGLVDFDGDGLLDLIVSNRRSPLELYRNTTPDAGNWLAVDLQQSGGNHNAVGSTIRVTANGLMQAIQQTVGGGHAGGQLLPRHFGIGDAIEAKIQVTWPDGAVSNHTSVGGVIATIRR